MLDARAGVRPHREAQGARAGLKPDTVMATSWNSSEKPRSRARPWLGQEGRVGSERGSGREAVKAAGAATRPTCIDPRRQAILLRTRTPAAPIGQAAVIGRTNP